MEDSIKNNQKLPGIYHYSILLCMIALFTLFGFIRINKQAKHIAIQVEQIQQHYDDLVYENEVL